MIKLKQRGHLFKLSLYYKTPLYAYKHLKLFTESNIGNIFVKMSSSQLILLRSPKHFNIGKLKLKQQKTIICQSISLDKPVGVNPIKKQQFSLVKNFVENIPFSKLTHVKIMQKINFRLRVH